MSLPVRALPVRPGMTVPLPGHLHSHAERLRELADLGYTDIWSSEADAADAFTPLAPAAAWEPRLRLATAIVPVFTRAPACLAQSVASLADAAPGRSTTGRQCEHSLLTLREPTLVLTRGVLLAQARTPARVIRSSGPSAQAHRRRRSGR